MPGCTVGSTFGELLNYITCIIGKSVIPLIFAIATVMFLWGVVQYVIGADEEKERAKGKQFIIWGIIALVVMFSIWGLVSVVTNTFKFGNLIPQVQNR